MVRDLMGQSWNALKHNRRRSVLTMLGMAWGIATVVVLLAYGAGFENAIMGMFRGFGGNLVMVFAGRTSMQAGGAKAGTEVKFTLDDVDHILAEVPFIAGITPVIYKNDSTVQHENRSLKYTVAAGYPVNARIQNLTTTSGSFFTQQDEDTHARVVVIGDEVKEKIFSSQEAIGKSLRIDGVSYTVVGILKHKVGGGGDISPNKQVFIPFSTMSDLRDTHYLDGIAMDYEGNANDKIVMALRQSMAYHHNFNVKDKHAVYVFDLKNDMEEFSIITSGLKVLLAFIGTLTLGIGGVGLMNIMLVSVQQRTREIGVEKALGARKRHIFTQFLAEALAITFSGGVVGIVISYIISFSVGSMTLFSAFEKHAEDYDIMLRIQPGTLMVAVVILSLVGVVSGMLPAIRAANLSPIEALRYE